MLVNKELLEELYEDAGIARKMRAIDYVRQKKVQIVKVIYENENQFEIRAKVEGHVEEAYQVYIKVENGEIEDVTCNCGDYQSTYGSCKHIVATMLEFAHNESYGRIFDQTQRIEKAPKTIEPHKEQYRTFKQLLQTFYQEYNQEKVQKEEPKISKRSIKIEPKLILERFQKRVKVEFKIGEKQFYKLKDLSSFLERMNTKETYHYGSKLEFNHEMEYFEEESIPLLQFMMKQIEIVQSVNENTSSSYYGGKPLSNNSIVLTPSALDEFFEIEKGKALLVKEDYQEEMWTFQDKNPSIEFSIEKVNQQEYKMTPNIDTYHYQLLKGRAFTYFLQDQKFYRCTKEFAETTLKLVELFRRNFTTEITFPKQDLTNFFALVLPKIREQVDLKKLDQEEIENYIPKKLAVKIFLDFDKNNYITADVLFCYGQTEFNPIEGVQTIPRDILAEEEVTNIFKKTGFLLDTAHKRFILADENRIYDFMSYEIEEYMKKFEVLATESFKQKEIKQPRIGNMGIRIENNLLSINLDQFNFDKAELAEILKKYRLKKKFYRLKDGSFLKLEESEEIQLLDTITEDFGVNFEKMEEGELTIPVYRGLYLEKILQNVKQMQVQKDENFKQMIRKIENKDTLEDMPIPKSLESILRYYQKVRVSLVKNIR